jgi:RimJ/RimL family protein N-acetyltransferase
MNTLTLSKLAWNDPRIKPLMRSADFYYGDAKRFTWYGVEEGDRLCGIGALELRDDVAWLYNGVVSPEYRGNGIHGDILRARVEHAQSQGYREIYVNVMTENLRCKNSLAKAGFRYESGGPKLETWIYDP